MPTAVFDPERARVDLRCDSGDWASATDRVTFQRRIASGAWETLPGFEAIPAAGSYALAVDTEMPLDSVVEYRALNRAGTPSTSTVSVDTSGAEWGLWVKVRGSHDRTQRVNWSRVGAISEEALGGIYQVHGGPAVAQFDGTSAEEVELEVWTEGRLAYLALRDLFKTDRRVFLQTAEPKEIEDGWWFAERVTYTNPDQKVTSEINDVRFATMLLRRIEAPAGALGGAVGTTYAAVRVQYLTYAGIEGSGQKYWQLRESE